VHQNNRTWELGRNIAAGMPGAHLPACLIFGQCVRCSLYMDIQMPEMDGLEAMRRIRAISGLHMTPIVATTALAMPGDRERCLEAGATAYLTKPVRLKELLAAIEQLVGDH
jgi:CheY-like chemotaxis protein